MESISIEDALKYSAFISIDNKRLSKTLDRLTKESIIFKNVLTFGKDMRPIFEATHETLYKKLCCSENSKFEKAPELFKKRYMYHLHNYGCSISHTHAIKHAKENNWPFILIFEDDVVPCINCLEHFKNALSQLPKDWEVLKFEDSYKKLIPEFKNIPADSINNYISYDSLKEWFREKFPKDQRVKLNEYIGIGAGAYIMNASIFDAIIEDCDKRSNIKRYYTPVADRRIFDYKLFYYKKLLFCQEVRYGHYRLADSKSWKRS